MTDERKIGFVKWYNKEKGYGFLVPAESGKDVFIHVSALLEAGLYQVVDGKKVADILHEGQKISYELKPTRGQMAAANIKVEE